MTLPASTAAMASDEMIKRRTDCVYFLASPLTCKKGNECEFRHSENARLNPRDCYYWMNGNCRNPSCAFRHPPLEGSTQTLTNSSHSTPYATVDMSKSSVPCYFYFNAYCIKGDQCPFSHDMSQKYPEAAFEPTPTNPVEIKTSTGSDTGPASVEVPANPSEGTSELVKQSHSKKVQMPAQGNVLEESSPSVESSVPESEEPGIKLPDSPLPPVEYINGSNEHTSQDQSSEELEKECVEQDEWWESSPGFDVLVDDGGSDQLAYQDDADYLLAQERESEMLQSHLLQYDFEGSVGYDLLGYPNAGYSCDPSAHDSYDHLESRRTPEYLQRDSEQSRERFSEPLINWKRKLSHREYEVGDRGDVDLRDHLRKRRRMDVLQVSRSSRKHRSSRTRGNSRERPVRRGMGPAFHGRLASEVGKNMIGSSHSESESFWNDHHRGDHWSGHTQFDRHARPRHSERENRRRHARPPPVLSEYSQSSALTEPKPNQVKAAGFTGPKTLAQIRGKNRVKVDNDGNGSHAPQRPRRPIYEDFEGPKPLNELLKDKKKHASVGYNASHPTSLPANSQAEKVVADDHLKESTLNYHGTSEKQDREYDSDFVDDDDDFDDDEDDFDLGFHEKLARISSQ